ncbi:hypothetical protein ACJX0J_013269 [Zea mays]
MRRFTTASMLVEFFALVHVKSMLTICLIVWNILKHEECLLDILITNNVTILIVVIIFLMLGNIYMFIGDLLLISLPTLNVGLVNLILQEKHEVDLDMSGDTCRIHYASTSV